MEDERNQHHSNDYVAVSTMSPIFPLWFEKKIPDSDTGGLHILSLCVPTSVKIISVCHKTSILILFCYFIDGDKII